VSVCVCYVINELVDIESVLSYHCSDRD